MRTVGDEQQRRYKVSTPFAEAFARMTGLSAADIRLPAAMLVAAGAEAIHQEESSAVSRELAEQSQAELILAATAGRARSVSGVLHAEARK